MYSISVSDTGWITTIASSIHISKKKFSGKKLRIALYGNKFEFFFSEKPRAWRNWLHYTYPISVWVTGLNATIASSIHLSKKKFSEKKLRIALYGKIFEFFISEKSRTWRNWLHYTYPISVSVTGLNNTIASSMQLSKKNFSWKKLPIAVWKRISEFEG